MYVRILGKLDIDIKNAKAYATRNRELYPIEAAQKLIMIRSGSKEEGAKYENLGARSTREACRSAVVAF